MEALQTQTMRILVIEDDPESNQFFQTALSSEGYEVVSCLCGEDALALDNYDFDVALVDIMMKNIDGIETCKRLKELNPKLPVCMVTASMDTDHVLRSFRLGANGYIVKPFDLDELFVKIDELSQQYF